MSTLIQLLETRDDSFIMAVTASSDSDDLKKLAQVWAKSTDPWDIEQLRLYVAQAFSCQGHEALLRQLLQSGEEADNQQLMAFLFVAFDRVIRRRRISKPVKKLVTERRRGIGCSIRTLGWFRRRIWAWFQDLSERDSSAYLQAACLALHQYHDDDFVTGESVLDNRSLMKLAFHGSPLITIDPVHACLIHDCSINDLSPAPWAESIWTEPNGVRSLIELASQGQARFIRWWAATVCCRGNAQMPSHIDRNVIVELVCREEPFLEPLCEMLLKKVTPELSAETWLNLITAASPILFDTVLRSFVNAARTGRLTDGMITDICRQLTSKHPSRLIAAVADTMHDRRGRIEVSADRIPFLQLALQTPGCSRSRRWLVEGLLKHSASSEQAARQQVTFLSRQISGMNRAAKMDVIHQLLVARKSSPIIESAIGQLCPEIQFGSES